MASSATIIVALRFRTGIIFASDSQVSDKDQGVRWATTKAQSVGNHPLAIAFSGSVGFGDRAREEIEALKFRPNTFEKRDRVRDMIDRVFQKQLDQIDETFKKRSVTFKAIYEPPVLVGLAAYFAEGQPQILDFERNGDSTYYESFRAIGSGGGTAYAVWQTLGGERLHDLPEGTALHIVLQIMRTTIAVDERGVSAPITVLVVEKERVRQLPTALIDSELEAVQEREDERVNAFLKEGGETPHAPEAGN